MARENTSKKSLKKKRQTISNIFFKRFDPSLIYEGIVKGENIKNSLKVLGHK